ncbi:MAG: transglycosylase SLT domain-containing protein [Bacteriovoracaceae bacterium]|nr:transglycosylase SLT domain-containing protein [Bacteriovoracaceae bacterium]
MNAVEKFLTVGAAVVFTSCAGPTNPFGSHVWLLSEFKTNGQGLSHHAAIETYPKRQVYHTPFDLVLNIQDDEYIPKTFRYEILHNGKRIERWWKSEKITFNPQNPKKAQITFENLSLLPGRKNEITFLYYRDKNAAPVAYKFLPPHCPLRANRQIASINPFEPKNIDIPSIEDIASRNKINPSLLAALVAQESSFNPLALSWAKALGLTQVTPIANKEIIRQRPDWKYDKDVEKLNFLQLKTSILTNRITKKQDWRLDEAKSLEGGSVYLNLLGEYWTKPNAKEVLQRSFSEESAPLTDILLASYNSGAYRVKKAIIRNKEKWLESKELKEARKYVMNIKSYCHAFTAKN